MSRASRSVISTCLVGSSLEWGDFFLYITADALVFKDLYHPNSGPVIGALLSFATYGIGFIARPVGAVVFGHFGDRLGRKPVLTVALLIMGMATFLMGLLPSYQSIGFAAPATLVALRLLQGFSLGGFWSGVVTMCFEQPGGRPGLRASWPQAGLAAGNVIAAGVLAAAKQMLSHDAFITWGWRVPFLLSGILMLIALWMRAMLDESPQFQALTEISSDPVREVFRTHRRSLGVVFCARIGTDASYYVFTVYLLTYVEKHLHLAKDLAVNAVLIGSAIQFLLIPLMGALADRAGLRRVYLAGAVGAGLWSFVFFPLLGAKSFPLILLAVAGFLAFHAAMYGPQAAFIAGLFEVRVRYSGTALGYHLASVPGGAVTVPVVTWLFSTFHSTVPITLYVVATILITIFGLLLAKPVSGG